MEKQLAKKKLQELKEALIKSNGKNYGLFKQIEREIASIDIEGISEEKLNEVWESNRSPYCNLAEELYNSLMGYICDVMDMLSVYKVTPDLYEGNDKQEALAWCLTDKATSLEVDKTKIDAKEFFDRQNLKTRVEAFLHYIADSHIKITRTKIYTISDEIRLHYFKFDGGESVALTYEDDESIVFHLQDWQGSRPESYEEIADYKWMVGDTGLKAIMLNGLPRSAF